MAGHTFVVMATFRMCIHVRSLCVCVCVHPLYCGRMTGTVIICCQLMYDMIDTHRTINRTKALWEGLGRCVCQNRNLLKLSVYWGGGGHHGVQTKMAPLIL